MASRDLIESRLPRILERIIEQTDAGELKWEIAAVPDGYAVTVGDVRFRVRSMTADGEQPYVLELLTPNPPASAITTGSGQGEILDALVSRLYVVARLSAVGDIPDPFESVEQALGLAAPLDNPSSA